MMAFWIVSALFAAGAMLLVLPPLLARSGRVALSHDAANLAVYRDQSRELDADLAAGRIDAKQHGMASRELEARLADEVAARAAAAPAPRRRGGTAFAAGVAIPLGAVALYLAVGTPQAIDPGRLASDVGAAQAVSAAPIERMVDQLAARLAQNPEDDEGWQLLARSYSALGRFAEAVPAMRNAVARRPDDAGLLADYANTFAMAQGGRLAGEPEVIIARAIAADPANFKAHALAGSAAFQKGEYAGAVSHWESLLQRVATDSEDARALRASIAEARARSRGG